MKYTKLVIIFVFIFSIYGCSTAHKNLTIVMPNLAAIADGIYRGSYDLSSTPVKATVDVSVKDHQIIKIDILEHFCSPIGKKGEKIIDLIIRHQSLDVDVISGATSSSKTILKAVENALQ
jgi:uncharacterized protein with FMN-binding domain